MIKIMAPLIFLLYFSAYFLFSAGFSNAMNYSKLTKYSLGNRIFSHRLIIKSGMVYRLNTAEGFVSVITLPAIPLDVAIGNSGAFQEQTVGRQIFIKPVTYDSKAKSNLEIYTKYGLINIMLRIVKAEYATYDLNLDNGGKGVFASNYIKYKVDEFKKVIKKKYNLKALYLKKEGEEIKKEKKEVMNLILLVNRKKINRFKRKDGIILTILSISHINNIYYIAYRITNNSLKPFTIRNIYLYRESPSDFLDGYKSSVLRVIYPLNLLPHNEEYGPYKILREVIIFKKADLGNDNIGISAHIIIGKRLIKLKINNILNE